MKAGGTQVVPLITSQLAFTYRGQLGTNVIPVPEVHNAVVPALQAKDPQKHVSPCEVTGGPQYAWCIDSNSDTKDCEKKIPAKEQLTSPIPLNAKLMSGLVVTL